MRRVIHGGGWKNVEDEVLKAAVMKYGLNNWARVASLLNRKTARQCKARWYEWLDPEISKIEWSLKEDEELLHLYKLFPTQWRTVAPMVGRTPAQCLARYNELLAAATGEAPTLPLSLEDAIAEHPEILPAQADLELLEDDEVEMLAEARARLANTRGKKAKRKAREQKLAEAKKQQLIQKRRELLGLGLVEEAEKIGVPKSRQAKRLVRRGGLNYDESEIPYELPPPAEIASLDAISDVSSDLSPSQRSPSSQKSPSAAIASNDAIAAGGAISEFPSRGALAPFKKWRRQQERETEEAQRAAAKETIGEMLKNKQPLRLPEPSAQVQTGKLQAMEGDCQRGANDGKPIVSAAELLGGLPFAPDSPNGLCTLFSLPNSSVTAELLQSVKMLPQDEDEDEDEDAEVKVSRLQERERKRLRDFYAVTPRAEIFEKLLPRPQTFDVECVERIAEAVGCENELETRIWRHATDLMRRDEAWLPVADYQQLLASGDDEGFARLATSFVSAVAQRGSAAVDELGPRARAAALAAIRSRLATRKISIPPSIPVEPTSDKSMSEEPPSVDAIKAQLAATSALCEKMERKRRKITAKMDAKQRLFIEREKALFEGWKP